VVSFSGLELLATAVVALDERFVVRYANPAAESLLATGAKSLIGQPFLSLFFEKQALMASLRESRAMHWDYAAQNVTYTRHGREPLPLSCMVTRIDGSGLALLAELRPISEQLRLAREERIKEADRLQALMDRMLTPHRAPRIEPMSVHEVLERVRSLVKAEFGVVIERDYDPSLPELIGDREQLIQAVLNIARNAAQAGSKSIVFRTRAVRQTTILRQRYRLALELQVIDDGPGVPEEIQERIFNPLVSGREGGTGLGLSLAQTFVQYHQGVIEFESRPGRTTFRILLPLT